MLIKPIKIMIENYDTEEDKYKYLLPIAYSLLFINIVLKEEEPLLLTLSYVSDYLTTEQITNLKQELDNIYNVYKDSGLINFIRSNDAEPTA